MIGCQFKISGDGVMRRLKKTSYARPWRVGTDLAVVANAAVPGAITGAPGTRPWWPPGPDRQRAAGRPGAGCRAMPRSQAPRDLAQRRAGGIR
jgi:hypothetical protein